MATKSSTNQEWANFDFRTWDPGKVQAGAEATFTGAALRSLLTSPDWDTNLAAGVSGLKKSVAPMLNAYATGLQQKMKALDDDLAAKTAAAQQQISTLQDSIRASAAPPQPKAEATSYQVATKVVDQNTKVGLPGVQVRVFDSQNPSVTLASGTTDMAGNVVLRLTREHTEAAAPATAATAPAKERSIRLEVVPSAGKAVFSSQLCPKLNQTETVVAGIESTPELTQRLGLANLISAQRQDYLRTIAAHAEALTAQHAQSKADLQQELDQVQSMIADLK